MKTDWTSPADLKAQLLRLWDRDAQLGAEFPMQLRLRGPAVGDAMHLAPTTYYECDILATWNCQRPPALPCGLCSAQAISLRSVAGTSRT